MKKLAPLFSFELGADRGEDAGCVAGVLRRVFCGNLRGRGCGEGESGGFAGERGKREQERRKRRIAQAADMNPGIVARLMGLESMPTHPGAVPDAISRTRSANSVEAWHGQGILGEQRSGQGGDSRFMTSQSFRELPTYLRKENEEFLVLCFGIDDNCESSEMNSSKKELLSDPDPNDMKESRAEKRSSRNRSTENYTNTKELSASEKAMEPKETAEKSISCRKKLSFTGGEVAVESSSQNSSPVSVLDHALDSDGESLTSPDSSCAGKKASAPNAEETGSAKKVSLDDERPRASFSAAKSKERGAFRTLESEVFARNFSDMLSSVCRLGDDHINKVNWLTSELVKCEEAEEIVAAIAQEILHRLLHEAVVENLFV
ncbi:hypothetical protein HPP92_003302 [Vanilla planifolia]|uniref:DUF3741 domain-containing protein n=1 Tax=Vanilla planifolia TaxID=51239 RepID=A0A835VN58_VANPL|nr:hypothetical protein HPP92_003302 [Vanilla planifolia]